MNKPIIIQNSKTIIYFLYINIYQLIHPSTNNKIIKYNFNTILIFINNILILII